jgi:hypothetical protein
VKWQLRRGRETETEEGSESERGREIFIIAVETKYFYLKVIGTT